MSLLALVCVFILVTTNAQDFAQEHLGRELVIVQAVVPPFVRGGALELVLERVNPLVVVLVLMIVLPLVEDAVLVARPLVVGVLEVVELGVRLAVLGNVTTHVLRDAPMLAKATVVKVAVLNVGVLVRLVAGELLSNI